MADLPTIKYLKDRVRYDENTGNLYWLSRTPDMFDDPRRCDRWNTRYAGREAFGIISDSGYKVGKIGPFQMRAHRVVWALVYGCWPPDQIDHSNHNRSDNRISNLVLASNEANQKNRRKQKNNTSGITGVYWNKKSSKWYSCIQSDGVQKYLGCFNCKSAAMITRKAADSVAGFHMNHGAS